MKTRLLLVGGLLGAASTLAMAQDMTRDQLNQRPQTMQERPQSVTPTARMNDMSRGGVQPGTSGSGTLMQQREQGMAPDSSPAPANGGQSTGTIKQ
jgi:hypothetical protein